MSRTRSILDEPGSGDMLWLLRWIDVRFEPRDPVFDADEDAEEDDEAPRPRPRTKAATRTVQALLAATLASSAACGRHEQAPRLRATDDAVLVRLRPGARTLQRLPQDDQGPPIVALEALQVEGEAPLLRVPLPAGLDPVEAARDLSEDPAVDLAEPVYLYGKASAPDDPRFKELWGLAQVGALRAWAHTVGDRKVIVAIVDDGVAITHPDLSANVWTNPQENEGAGEDPDGDGHAGDVHGWNFVEGTSDPSGQGTHGTQVAGIIGAVGDNHLGVVGMAWSVSLMPLRALGEEGGRSDELARAIDYAVDHGARVVNLSWSGPARSEVLRAAIARAGARGALVVAAAGNEGAAEPGFPASLGPGQLLSVAASAPDDALAPFSNRGALVAAPGVGILSTAAAAQYQRGDGTSMAAAHVSGLAALLWSAHPDATLAQVRAAIEQSAVPLAGTLAGRIDAADALARLDAAPAQAAAPLVTSRAHLSFAFQAGHAPRAQSFHLRSTSGAPRPWQASTAAPWLHLSQDHGVTPARIAVRVDPSLVAPGDGEGQIVVSSAEGAAVRVTVRAQALGAAPAFTLDGRCDLREGALHVRAQGACTLVAPGLERNSSAASVRWRLPGGQIASGPELFAHFVRPGTFALEVTTGEDDVTSLPVVIE